MFYLINEKKVCLTLDLECDYGTALLRKTYHCLEKIDHLIDILKSRDIPLTCFVQTSILQSHPFVIEKLKELDVEFEPHSHNYITYLFNKKNLNIEEAKIYINNLKEIISEEEYYLALREVD